jgi:hypothetical protein
MSVRGLFVLLPALATLLLAGCKSRETTVQLPANDSLVQQFARLKNAGDNTANDLIAPGPDLSQTVIEEEDKPAFDAAFVLHEPSQIVEIIPDDPTALFPRFAFVLKGGFATPKVTIRNKNGLQAGSQRILSNPEVLVEVREGRIHPLKVGLPRIRPQTR